VKVKPAQKYPYSDQSNCFLFVYDATECVKVRPAQEYHYLNHSDCLSIDKVDDAEQFYLLRRAMNVVQISNEDQEQAFEMLSAVLWLGNITFHIVDHDNVIVDENEGKLGIS
jgi:myosin-5